MRAHKTLIIKTGYSEILDINSKSREVSLGDVFRTTLLLHNFKNDYVVWLTDEKAKPLLEGNPYITRIMYYDFTTRDQLLNEEFDTVVNLEKFPPLCALANQITTAWRKCGFRLDRYTGEPEAFDRAYEVLNVSADPLSKKESKRPLAELLFEMVGAKWTNEEPILGYKPKTTEVCDIALNTLVGNKWPVKAWPNQFWDNLEARLTADGLKVTRQDKQNEKIRSDLNRYIDWLNSSRVIVSTDSLGLHLGLALGKKVIGLFGPTPDKEVFFYNRGEAIIPAPTPDCLPCFQEKCARGSNCMDAITPERVYEIVNKWRNYESPIRSK